MDAITLLKADHKTLEKHFREFEAARARAKVTRAHALEASLRELAVHAAIEEQVLYPVIRDEVPDLAEDVLLSLEEHHVVKWLCAEIAHLSLEDERLEPKMAVLMANVRQHVQEEESDVFPMVRDALGRRRLVEVGEILDKAKAAAPTRPHPRSPDTPPANLVVGMVAGAVDRARDMGQRLVGHLTP